MTILQDLDRYYGRMAARGDVVPPGWSMEPVGIVLELSAVGDLLGTELRLDARKKPQVIRMPKWFTRSGNGSTPYFLWDNAAYALGLGAKDPGKTAKDHAAFRKLHLDTLESEVDPGLAALRRFLDQWTPDRSRVPALDDKALVFSLAFRLQGDTALLHERPAAHVHLDRLRTAAVPGDTGFCLILGAYLPLVRLHPKIKGVDGTASAEVPLVSFNADAFTSLGKEQGYNAPTSAGAAFRYGAALNALLARGSRNRLRIADATVAFWADASALDAAVAEAAARQAEDVFASLNDDTPAAAGATDADQAARVRERLQEVAAGAPLTTLGPDLREGVRFHVLALAPNAARLSVRVWLSDDFGRFARALGRHQQDLALEPAPRGGRWPPSVQRLLTRTTALLEKADNVPPGLAGAVLRAVLSGTPYPRTLLASVIGRLRAGDDRSSGWHAATIKACLSRTRSEEPVPVSIDPDNPSPAYQLGRLFAVIEKAQREALGRVNASVGDRYYGAFSATPARVFATLMRGARTHISAAHKLNRGFWLDKRLEQIIAKLPEALPTTLRLEDQGRFAVGYYHERAYFPPKTETPESTEPETP
jgi:CRISPR-associated protein Csd1